MQLPPRILGREPPLDLGAGGVARLLQFPDFTLERLFVADAPVQTLTAEDAQLDLGDVEPTAMLRRVVELQPPSDAACFLRREGLIQRGHPVRVQVVEHDPHPLGLRVGFIHQPLHLPRKVLHRALPRDFDMPPTALRLTKHKEVAHPLAAVLIIEALRSSGLSWQRLARLGDKLLARLVEADHGASLIVRLGVEVKHVLHRRDELRVHLADAPLLVQPRLELVFFSTWRTVSRVMEEAKPNSTTLSASSRSVQRARPPGGVLHATATRCASCLPESFRSPPRRGRSLRHPRPSSTKRRRVRSTVLMPQESAATICSSAEPVAASSRMRARVTLRDECLPRRTSWRKVSRSSAERSTRYFFLGTVGQSPVGSLDQTIPVQRANHQNQTDGLLVSL